jgi:hypothetical protein
MKVSAVLALNRLRENVVENDLGKGTGFSRGAHCVEALVPCCRRLNWSEATTQNAFSQAFLFAAR